MIYKYYTLLCFLGYDLDKNITCTAVLPFAETSIGVNCSHGQSQTTIDGFNYTIETNGSVIANYTPIDNESSFTEIFIENLSPGRRYLITITAVLQNIPSVQTVTLGTITSKNFMCNSNIIPLYFKCTIQRSWRVI